MTTPIIDRLRLNILFENIDEKMFQVLKKKLQERRYRSNEIILEDESDGNELFLIAEGRCARASGWAPAAGAEPAAATVFPALIAWRI